jgi:hypothetical protein
MTLASSTAVSAPAPEVTKVYSNCVPNSTFIMPDGAVLRFAGNTYYTSNPAEIAELDKIAGTCGISAGVEVKPDEQKKLLDAAAAKLAASAAAAQKAEQDELLKRAG